MPEMDSLKAEGDISDFNERYTINTKSNNRYHANWLNMMYPRLLAAKDLLADDGAIFISIDDNELENLKNICNMVFGETNYVAIFPWRKRTAKSMYHLEFPRIMSGLYVMQKLRCLRGA